MTVEAILAYLHIAAFLTLVVFVSSEAALCRPEWMNAAVVERLVTLDRVYGLAAAAVFLTGLARMFLGAKGIDYYATNGLLHLKIGLFVVAALVSIRPTRRFLQWRKALRAGGALPDADEVRAVRKWVMRGAHIVPLIPLPAVFLARGWGS